MQLQSFHYSFLLILAMSKEYTWTNFLYEMALVTVPMLAGLAVTNYVLKGMHGPKEGVESARIMESMRKAYIQWRKNGNDGEFPTFDEYEQCILTEIVFPDSVSTSLDDIGGLQEIKDSLIETVVLPLRSQGLYATLGRARDPAEVPRGLYSNAPAGGHDLLSAPLGVLFYVRLFP